jgi:hypothetical protein
VTQYPRELGPAGCLGQLPSHEVVVRAADPDRLGRDHELTRTGLRRLRALRQRDIADRLGYDRAHVTAVTAAVAVG